MDFYKRGISGIIGDISSAVICSATALFCLQPDGLRISKIEGNDKSKKHPLYSKPSHCVALLFSPLEPTTSIGCSMRVNSRSISICYAYSVREIC